MLHIDEQQRRLVVSIGGRGLLVIGLALAGVGAAFAISILDGGATVNNRPARPIDIWFPLIIVLVGLAIAFCRYRRELDLDQGEVVTTFTCLFPVYRKVAPLAALRHVSLKREIRRSNKRKIIEYPVSLETEGRSYDLSSRQNELSARRDAEVVARLTGLDLVDRSSGGKLVRSAEELDQSVLEREGAGEAGVREPAGCRIEIEPSIEGTRIRVPVADRYRYARWIPLLILIVPIGFALYALRPQLSEKFRLLAHGDAGASDLIGGWQDNTPHVLLIAFPLLVFLAVHLSSDKRPRTLVVDRQGVRLLGFVGSVTIPARELEELQISTKPVCLLARSDKARFRCGYGLSHEELAFLRQTIMRGLRGH